MSTIKRFGARYGTKAKKKIAKIEKSLRKKSKCPYCNKHKVKRLAYGIWHCKSCKSKFTGKSYSIKEKIVFEEKAEEKKSEQPQGEKDG